MRSTAYQHPFLVGIAVSLMLMLTSCGQAESYHYTIPDRYEGFLAIRYDCPNGELTTYDQRTTQIHFHDNGTVCLTDSYTVVHPTGLTVFPSASTRNGQQVPFKGSDFQGVTGDALVDLLWRGSRSPDL
jgi:hypothetical protein